MAEFENNNGVFGDFSFNDGNQENNLNQEQGINIQAEGLNQDNSNNVFKKVEADSLPIKPSIWSKIKAFLFQEIDWKKEIRVELTPYQQKVEKEINDFLHQEVSFKGFFDILKGKKN